MLSRMVSRIAIPAVGLFAALAPLAYAAPQSRIVAAISDSSRVPIQHTIPSRARIANDLGSAPGATKLNSLSLRFNIDRCAAGRPHAVAERSTESELAKLSQMAYAGAVRCKLWTEQRRYWQGSRA